MNDFNDLSVSQSTRSNLSALRKRLLKRAGKAPVVVNLLPALPSDNVMKLQLSRQGTDCEVTIDDVQVPPGAQNGDTGIYLLKDDVAITAAVALPIPPPATLTMHIPALETATPGTFRLKYETFYATNTVKSDEFVFYIDNTAPHHGAPGDEPVPDPKIVNGVVTKEILDELDGIPLTIDPPDDMREGDIYTGYYGKSDPGIAVAPFIVTSDLTRPIVFKVPKNIVTTVGPGSCIFYTKFEDRVGNSGPSSIPVDLNIRLTPAPSGLLPPVVGEFDDDGVIDLNDAWPDVAVVIPAFTGGQPGDQVQVTFNGVVQPLANSDGTTAVIVDVPFADVALGGEGPKQADVTYVILRGTDRYPEPVGEQVDIDLTTPGPVLPNPDPELGNPNLDKLVVKGSTADNELRPGDVGNLIDIELEIYDGYKAGDLVDLYWNKVKVPAPDGHYAVDGSEAPDFKIPFKLPSAIFEATGNGFWRAQYKITNPPINGANENPSPPTIVDVLINPVDLPDPEILHLATNPLGKKFLDCSSVKIVPVVGRAAIVKIPGGGALEAGMTLDFNWIGTQGVPSDPDIPDYPFSKTLEGNEHIDGFEVSLPYQTALVPITDGEGEIIYTVVINGQTHTSNGHKVRVVLIDTGGGACRF